MRILHITTQKPFQTGSGTYLLGLVKGLNNIGVENRIICGVSSHDDMDSIRNCTTSEIVPVLYETLDLPFPVLGMSNVMPYKSIRYGDLTENHIALLKEKFLKEIKKQVLDFKPDAIICQHLYLLTAFIREAFPEEKVFGVCHGSDLRQINTNPLMREYIKNEISRLDGIFSLHGEMTNEILNIFKIETPLVYTTGTGFSEDIFKLNLESSSQKIALKKDYLKEKGKELIEIVYTGKLSKAKGIFELLPAIERVANACDDVEINLTLIGGSSSDEEANHLEKLMGEVSFNVKRVGVLSQNEIAKIYSKSDIFVLPSYYEGLPLVIPEALSSGLVVISNDLPYLKDWKEEFRDGIIPVKTPTIINEDELLSEKREEYIKNLSDAIEQGIKKSSNYKPLNLFKLSFKALAQRIVDYIN